MQWSEFLQIYETHDSSFEKIEYDISQKQCKLYLEVQPIYPQDSDDRVGNIKTGWLIGEEIIQFSLEPKFDIVSTNFDGEILSLSIKPDETQKSYKILSIAFLVFDHSNHSHTFHMLEMVALNIRWSELSRNSREEV